MFLFQVFDEIGIIENFKVESLFIPWMMVMSDNVAHFLNQFFPGAESGEDLPRYRWTLLLLLAGIITVVFLLGILNSDGVEKGSEQDNCRITTFLFHNLFCIPGYISGMADALKVPVEKPLHLDCHPIFQEVLPAGYQFRGKIPEALLSEFAVSCASKIHPGIDKLVPALFTPAGSFILEEFNGRAALGALCFKDCIRFPEAAVLSRALHFDLQP